MQISRAQASDDPAILEIILPVIREGATYSLDPDLSATEALAYWLLRFDIRRMAMSMHW
jgi:hypothetical protein